MTIKENLETIHEDIEIHARKGGFDPADVQLITVTKTVPPERMREALEAGENQFGENRVQELLKKYPLFPEVDFHLIGSLQTNKVRQLPEKLKLIHSLDRPSLLKELERIGKRDDRTFHCLVQMNISKEESKSGLYEDELDDFLQRVEKCERVRVEGLMTMAPYVEDPEEVRPIFRKMRELFEKHAKIRYNRVEMKYLSMGMTNDYKIALEEGANMLRIGSFIFGKRK